MLMLLLILMLILLLIFMPVDGVVVMRAAKT